jgi:DNA mismatch repair protein MutS2
MKNYNPKLYSLPTSNRIVLRCEMRMKSCYTASAMDVKSFDVLELQLILDRLERWAAFSASKELARALSPTVDFEQVQRRQAETSEARLLLSHIPDLTIGGAHDMRPSAKAAARGKVLEPTELLDLKSTLIAARNLKRIFEKSEVTLPVLSAEVDKMELAPGLIDSISKTLDDRGEVLDSASEKLAKTRRDMRVAHDRITDKLQGMISDPKIARMLQEPIITQRDGRFVIPLQADFKGRIKAVIHDQSASGATLFIEPLRVVDLNNELRELRLGERDEIRRILAELSSQVGEFADEISATVGVLATIDLAFAKARYADAIKANEPILKDFSSDGKKGHPGSTLSLLAARHPLLDPNIVVPIDFTLDTETFALVITGPNTGGKTVSLKTVGLLALMAQCGLHIPATSGSELSVFDAVYADIGDEQSIEQSLSTFSAHVSNITRILELATPQSLVILDELGAGTDPEEGAALARAILGTLLDRGITTLVATHYPEMKTFAHSTPGVRNASVEFDLESLRPTFHLTIGLPGRSNALSIAERLGLDKKIVERARTMVSPEELRAESLLDEIHHQRDLARQERSQAAEDRRRIQALERELAERLDSIDEERRDLLEEANQEIREEVDALKEDVRSLRRRLASAAEPLNVVRDIEDAVDEVQEKYTISKPHPSQIAANDQKDANSQKPVSVGEKVRIRTIDAVGVITSLDDERAEVQVGRLRVRASLEELDLINEVEAPELLKEVSLKRAQRARVGASVPPLELDVRGQTVDEALDELERRLDAAFLAGMPFIRIIHGKGTGRLRKAVRKALEGNAYVSSFETGKPAEGGEGVTIVHLSVG